MRFITVAGAAALSAAAALPVYFHALGVQRQQEAVLAEFDQECSLARLRLAGGAEFWSARIMANRCDAAGR